MGALPSKTVITKDITKIGTGTRTLTKGLPETRTITEVARKPEPVKGGKLIFDTGMVLPGSLTGGGGSMFGRKMATKKFVETMVALKMKKARTKRKGMKI
jgi:hypothetical protein